MGRPPSKTMEARPHPPLDGLLQDVLNTLWVSSISPLHGVVTLGRKNFVSSFTVHVCDACTCVYMVYDQLNLHVQRPELQVTSLVALYPTFGNRVLLNLGLLFQLNCLQALGTHLSHLSPQHHTGLTGVLPYLFFVSFCCGVVWCFVFVQLLFVVSCVCWSSHTCIAQILPIKQCLQLYS